MNFNEVIKHGHYFEYRNWATTSIGTEIACFSSYPLDDTSNANPILLIGGVHGDEPEGVRLAEETLKWLANSSYKTEQWILIPCINPDGINKGVRTNSNGVDLNRNYPSKNWAPEASKERYYPGPKPGSEKETQAIVQIMKRAKPKLVIHCHSWQPCVVYTGDIGIGRAAAKVLAEASGYESKDSIGYDCPGSLGDFGSIDMGIPVVCIEAQEGDPLDSIWPKFEGGVKRIFQNTL